MNRKTLKSMGIRRTFINKHGVAIQVYEHKGIFWTSKELAIKAYENG